MGARVRVSVRVRVRLRLRPRLRRWLRVSVALLFVELGRFRHASLDEL